MKYRERLISMKGMGNGGVKYVLQQQLIDFLGQPLVTMGVDVPVSKVKMVDGKPTLALTDEEEKTYRHALSLDIERYLHKLVTAEKKRNKEPVAQPVSHFQKLINFFKGRS